MALLEVNGITKVFGGLVAVENVEFQVDSGEIVSIIGPNGAGKTTIYNMLTGVYPVDGGNIVFDGKRIENLPPREIVKAGIARTFQNIRLFPTMRVIENVLVGEHINTHYSFLDLLLRTLGLGDQIDNYSTSLPYGMQRKLEIARALATNAKLIILDEPAAGMNPQESEELMDFIRHLRSRGITILLIEHDMSVVMNISDRIYVIDHGRKIAEGLPKDISTNPEVVRAYLGTGAASAGSAGDAKSAEKEGT